MIQTLSKFTERVFYRSSYDAPLTFIQFLTKKEKGLWNFTASRRALKSIRYLWFYLAQLDDSNAEIVQIYRKSDLLKFLRCAVNIHLIFDREKLALDTRWQDNWQSSLKFHGMPASFEKYSISLVLFGTIGWFKRWNSSNLQKKWFIEVLTLRR